MVHPGIFDALIEVAREGATITCGEIGCLANRGRINLLPCAVLGLMLDATDRHEHVAGQPFLSAVVVLKQTAISSRGFLACTRARGVEIGLDERAFWAAELHRVYDYWGQR
ncbi:MAG: hypothetical protein IT337_08920 [Thermomicrobiales bacterium]|nr:hypothetical protein [Thermomicrobiales bacterium]